MHRATRLLAGGMLGIALLAAPAAGDEPRYQTWAGAGGTPEVKAFIEQLNKMIDEADEAQAADPQFIEDLRAAVNSFQNPWQVRLLEDDFRDGEFASNPAWTVSAGQFKVDTKGAAIGLNSKVLVPGTQTGGQNLTTAIIGALLQQPAAAKYASIFTPVKITNAFAVRMELYSKEKGGRIDLGAYQGSAGNVGYRIAYFPGAQPAMQLLKLTSQGAAAVGTFNGPLNLEDGALHVVEWTRDRAGAMTVAVDGKPLISATDRGIRQPFDGFMLINSGGSFWLRSISIDGVKS